MLETLFWLFQCSKNPRCNGSDYSFYVKTIETHSRAFLALNILAIDRVHIIIVVSIGGWRIITLFLRSFRTIQNYCFLFKQKKKAAYISFQQTFNCHLILLIWRAFKHQHLPFYLWCWVWILNIAYYIIYNVQHSKFKIT